MKGYFRVAFSAAIALALCFALTACRAMEKHHTDGSEFPDDQGPYYGSGKKAEFGRRSFVSVWQSGDLAGACETVDLVDDENTSLIDNVLIEVSALFDTSSSDLSAQGQQVLDQLLSRVQQYEKVRKIELQGYADVRGSSASNQSLSERRVATVRSYLVDRVPPDAVFTEFALGESESLFKDNSEASLQQNRRVVVKIQAHGVKRKTSSRSLCKPAGHRYPNGVTQISDDVRSNTLVVNHNSLVFGSEMILSVGDRVRLRVAEDPDIDGIYEVSHDGSIDIPYAGKVRAAGSTVRQLERNASERLVAEGIVKKGFAKVDVAILQWSPADVYVSGAVFVPGRKTINGLHVDIRNFKQTQASGDSGRERMLSNALSSAGGIRPDADLTNIVVLRDGYEEVVDLSGVLSGQPVEDLPLINGDSVVVPSIGVFQDSLVRVSQITPPGVRLFISNLSVPTQSNALSNVGKDSSSMPYGTRFLDALLSANCVGGTQYTNSARRAVLIGTNPITGQTEVIERSVQQLVSDPNRDSFNPYLMPNDGVACYDSEVSNIRDVARVFTEVLSPLSLLKTLLK